MAQQSLFLNITALVELMVNNFSYQFTGLDYGWQNMPGVMRPQQITLVVLQSTRLRRMVQLYSITLSDNSRKK